jgi:putative transposase
MCSILKVGRTSYYDWLRAQPSFRQLETERLAKVVKEIFIDNYCNYGARRIRKAMNHLDITISRRRVVKLMKNQGLYCKTKKKFRNTTDSNHSSPIAPNLLARDFTATAPDQKYVGDITYVWTDEGWLYLATVIDLYSRKVVGWSMQDNMRVSLVNDALLMAIWTRKPARGLLWHSDRGVQYACKDHRDVLDDHGIIQSMSRKGNCWDNAVAESFFHTLKTELVYHLKYKTREEARCSIFKYIETYYNRKRLHSANDYLAPEVFEKVNKI